MAEFAVPDQDDSAALLSELDIPETAAQARARLQAEVDASLTTADKAEVLSDVAKEQARLLGMQVARSLLAQSGQTPAEVSALTGIKPETLSRIATGFHDTGPKLWTLLAISQAVGIPLTVALQRG
ncbi:helix-turn-helix domain-containing protein [Shimia sp.]|uniref:helix-turn-helix domain-containing protein n=1 Tax=Shimia sp. TaxID=1954381 RepID=UPI003B8D7DDE